MNWEHLPENGWNHAYYREAFINIFDFKRCFKMVSNEKLEKKETAY